jgi:hypothetical protein
MRLLIKEQQSRHIDPRLDSVLAEHEQVAALDANSVDRYRAITARVVLRGSRKSRSRFTTMPSIS